MSPGSGGRHTPEPPYDANSVAIVQQFVGMGGFTRFVQGLVAGLLEDRKAADWKLTLITPARDQGDRPVEWPLYRDEPRFRIRFLPPSNSRLTSPIRRMARGQRLLGIKGTGRLQRALAARLETVLLYGQQDRRNIERMLRHDAFDLAYFPYPYQMACPELSSPLVITIHDFNYKRFETLSPGLRNRVERETPRWIEHAARIVVSSDFMASELEHFYPGFRHKTRVVRGGIPTASAIPSASEVQEYKTRLGLPDKFILTTGWVVPHKNQAVVFEALSELRARGSDIGLVCAGPNSHELLPEESASSPYAERIRALCRDRGLNAGRDYWVLGYVSDRDLECLYRLAAAIVIPTLYEAGSFAGLEAMAAGCPVIFSRIPAHEEQAAAVGGHAWLFDPQDAAALVSVVESMLGDPSNVSSRVRAAADSVGRVYSWENMARGYLSVFEEALA